jgi:hypothetical protein
MVERMESRRAQGEGGEVSASPGVRLTSEPAWLCPQVPLVSPDPHEARPAKRTSWWVRIIAWLIGKQSEG